MTTDASNEAGPPDRFEEDLPVQPSINQLVAYNMTRARRYRGWTQQDVAERLEKYTGRSWSKASVSAAERSWRGGRPRRFDANELVALGVIFNVPLANFFMPPEKPLTAVKMAQPEEEATATFYLLGVKTLISLALMDFSKDPLKDEFLPRAWNAARDYLGVEYHTPVFLDPDLGLPQIRVTRTAISPLPADPDEDDSAAGGDGVEQVPVRAPEPDMGMLQHIDEVAGRLTPEGLRRYNRSEAIAAAYEAYKKWEDQGAPQDGPPDESEVPDPPRTPDASNGWGNYPEKPPF